jgi:hypothetical protein
MITSIHTLIYSDDPIEEREYGRVVMMIVPAADDMQLYQPTHKLAYSL